jgi:hypothetical protein
MRQATVLSTRTKEKTKEREEKREEKLLHTEEKESCYCNVSIVCVSFEDFQFVDRTSYWRTSCAITATTAAAKTPWRTREAPNRWIILETTVASRRASFVDLSVASQIGKVETSKGKALARNLNLATN